MNTVQNFLTVPQAYAVYVGTQNAEAEALGRWNETSDLLLGHIRHLAHKADFDFERLNSGLDALAVRLGIYDEADGPSHLGQWMGALDTAEHKPLTTAGYQPEEPAELYAPFPYWFYRSRKDPVSELILGWGEPADLLLSVIRLRAHAASKKLQGFEDLVTWLDDLALSKGVQEVSPPVATATNKMFGFDAFDMREAVAIAA